MALGKKLRDLDRRAESRWPVWSPRESTAMRLGVASMVLAGVFAVVDPFLDAGSFAALVLSLAFTGGILIGRVTEVRNLRRGRGALRPDTHHETAAPPTFTDR